VDKEFLLEIKDLNVDNPIFRTKTLNIGSDLADHV
jgi:hypothetical protein